MKILITGGTGFLGKYLIKSLDNGNEIYTLARNNSSFNFNLETNVPNLNESFDLVIHAAGRAHQTNTKSLNLLKLNVAATQNLLTAFNNTQRPKFFIFISSVSVYGMHQGELLNENTKLLAKDEYGRSKIEIELLLKEWCRKNSIILTILRLPLVIGKDAPGNLRSMVQAIKKGYYFNIAGGKARKSMVLAEDVANSILKVYKIGGIYNLTDGYHPSFFEISNLISGHFNKGSSITIPRGIAWIISKFGDLIGKKSPFNTSKFKKMTLDLTFDDSRAREVFGWNPTPVLKGFKL